MIVFDLKKKSIIKIKHASRPLKLFQSKSLQL